MFGIGLPELILILIVALLVVGPKKLPELARSVGKAIHDIKKMGEDVKDSLSADLESHGEDKDNAKPGTQAHAEGPKNKAGDSDGPEAPGDTKPDPYNNLRG